MTSKDWTSNPKKAITQSLPWIQDRPITNSSAKSQSESEKCPNPGVEAEVQSPNAALLLIKSSVYESVEGTERRNKSQVRRQLLCFHLFTLMHCGMGAGFPENWDTEVFRLQRLEDQVDIWACSGTSAGVPDVKWRQWDSETIWERLGCELLFTLI